MGLEYQEGNFSITQYNQTEKAEIKLDQAVGLSRQEDGTWAMVGDFYHASSQQLKNYYHTHIFDRELGTAYAIEQSKAALEEQSFFCSENETAEVGSDNLIHMVYERYQ